MPVTIWINYKKHYSVKETKHRRLTNVKLHLSEISKKSISIKREGSSWFSGT